MLANPSIAKPASLVQSAWLAIALLSCGICPAAVDPEPPAASPATGAVEVWVTTADATKKLEKQTNLSWRTDLAASATNALVDETTRHQEIDGFGATIRMPSIWQADPAVRDEIMRLLFSRSSGIGLNMMRVPMGETGLTGPNRTYNDLPSGQTDPTLAGFSIAGDLEWKLPMMQQAKALNPELTLLGTPWSAPAWMKTSGNLGYGKLKPEYYGVYANYFVRWLQEWRDRGLGISALTLQNEPQHEPYWYQGMRMEAEDQIALALQLGPAIRNAGFSTRIACWDHNCDNIAYPITVMNDPVARNWIHGAAFHAYAGTTSDIYQFTDEHPDKAVYFTEQTGTLPSSGFGGSLAWHARNIFLVPSLNGARCNLVWMLDRQLQSLSGDRPFVRVTQDGKGYELYGEYYETGHFSKFIRKGATRIGTNNPRDAVTKVFSGPLLYGAYQNPDGSKVLVALNDSGSAQTFTLEDQGRRVSHTLAAGALASFVWRDATGGSGLAATYFDNADLTGLSEQRIDPLIDFTWHAERFDATENFTFAPEPPLPSLGPVGFSARWEGTVVPPNSETLTFHATTRDGVRLWVNNQLVIDQWQSQPVTETSGSIQLTANQPASIRMEYFSAAAIGGGRAALAWSSPSLTKEIIPRSRLFPPAYAVVPPPPLGLIVRAPDTAALLAWNPTPAAATYSVKRADTANGPYTTLASGLTNTSYTDNTTVAGNTYFYSVTATNAQGESAASAPLSVTPRGSVLGPPWLQQDIGSTGTTGFGGNASNAPVIALAGAGSDIWGTADAFRFAYLPMTGDGTIVARVLAQESTHEWAKTGVMMRESLAANSRFVDAVITPRNGVAFQYRSATGGAAAGTNTTGPIPAYWLKLVRSGSTFTGFSSPDGVTWTQIAAPVDVPMTSSIYVGLASCSKITGTLGISHFDGISAPGLTAPVPTETPGLAATAGNASVGLSWKPAAYATSYRVFRSTTQGGPYSQIATVSSTAFTDLNALNETPYYYIVRGANSAGEGGASAEVSATPSSSYLPGGWINRDIGAVGFPGSATYQNSTYTIQASGATVWGTADSFNYSYASVSGDGSMTVRVDSLVNTSDYAAKSGIMFRTSDAANSAYAFLAITPIGGVKFEYRSAAGVSAASQASVSGSAPRWLRLVRIGTAITAFSGTDGDTWTQVGSPLTIDLGSEMLAGLAVTANNNTAITTSTLSQFSSTGFKSPLTPGGLVATPGLDGVRLLWDGIAAATGYRVKRSTNGGVDYTLIGTVSTPGFFDPNVQNRTTYHYVVTALNADGESAPSAAALATVLLAPLPSAWTMRDVGTPSVAGYADHTASSFTVAASGASLTTTSDEFGFCHLPLSGAVEISARVATVGTASSTAKAGVMLRESTATGARFAYVGISPNGTVEYRYRTSSNGSVTVAATATGQSLPRYFRLTVTRSSRRSTFTAFHSADGISWTQIGSNIQITNMPSSLIGGLAVCPMNHSLLHTATFDQVKATGFAAPAAPTGLAASGTPASIELSWNTVASASLYQVKRSTSPGGPFTYVGQSIGTTFSDTSVENHLTYHYTVTALNSFSESAGSAPVSAAPTLVAPPAPTEFTATAGDAQIALSWSAVGSATGYIVQRASASGGPYLTVASPTGTSFTDTGLTNGSPYFYIVLATNSAGSSSPSAEVSATPVSGIPVAPGAPTGLAATPGNLYITLTWSVVPTATSYQIKRSTTSGGPYTVIASPNGISFADTNLTAGTPYFYVATAVNVAGESQPSAEATATPSAAGPATWTGAGNGASRAFWSADSNWSLNPPPDNGPATIALVFNNTNAASFAQNDIANLTVSSIDMPASFGGISITSNDVIGQKLILSGNVIVSTANPQALHTDIGLTGNRGLVVNSSQLILGGNLTDGTAEGGILKTGTGTLILKGTGSMTGVSTQAVTAGTPGGGTHRLPLLFNAINAGSVVLQNTAALGSATNRGIQFHNNTNGAGGGGILDLQTDTSVNAYSIFSGSLGSGSVPNIILANRLTQGPGITHGLGLLQTGSATLTVNQGSNVTGGTAGVSFSAVSLTAGNNNAPVTLNGNAAISLGPVATTANATNNRRLGLAGNNANNMVTGVISNLATGVTGTSVLSLIKSEASTWTLTGANTYTGPTTIAAGTLRLGDGGGTGSLNPVSTIQNGGTLAFNRSGTITQSVDFASTIGAYTTDYSSNAAGVALVTPVSGKLVKSASGNLILTGSNTLAATDALTFSGTNSGTVTLRNPAALGAAGNTIRFSGSGSGMLDLQTDSSVNAYQLASGTGHGGTVIANRLTPGTNVSHSLGALDLSSVTLTVNKGTNVSASAVVSFTELKLTGGNDFNPVTLAGDADITVGSASITNNGIAKRLQLDGTSASNSIGTISNGIAGASISLIKANTGTWTLTGDNSYSGNTSVLAGSLVINGNQSTANGAVTVGDNNLPNGQATLGGTGTVGGAITVLSDGILAPGTTTGTMNAASSVTLNGRLAIQIDGLAADRLVVAGNLNIANATLDFILPGAGATAPEYLIATFGTLTGSIFATVTDLPPDYEIIYDLVNRQIKLAKAIGFEAWIKDFVVADPGATADPDLDGLANVIEYVLGGNPAQHSPHLSPTCSATDTSLIYTFHRNDTAETSDVSLHVEFSPDLVNWPQAYSIGSNSTNSSPGVHIEENGSGNDTVIVTIPLDMNSRKFSRLRVSTNP